MLPCIQNYAHQSAEIEKWWPIIKAENIEGERVFRIASNRHPRGPFRVNREVLHCASDGWSSSNSGQAVL
jgi:hypothetical protein